MMFLRYAAAFATALLLPGCLIDALTSSTQGVSVIAHTPDLSTAEGLDDANLRAALPLDQLDSNATIATVGIGQRTDPLSLEDPTPVTGATVEVEWDGNAVTVCDSTEEGSYVASSVADAPCSDAALQYVAGSEYVTTMTFEGESHSARVAAPAAIAAANVAFDPALVAASDHFGALLPSHPANTALNVDWSDDPSAGDRPAFLTVFRMRYVPTGTGDALNSANWVADREAQHDSLPRTPRELIDIVLLDNPPTDADIPAAVFDATGVYLIVLTATELSTNTEKLAVGSGALAGAGTAFIVWVE